MKIDMALPIFALVIRATVHLAYLLGIAQHALMLRLVSSAQLSSAQLSVTAAQAGPFSPHLATM